LCAGTKPAVEENVHVSGRLAFRTFFRIVHVAHAAGFILSALAGFPGLRTLTCLGAALSALFILAIHPPAVLRALARVALL